MNLNPHQDSEGGFGGLFSVLPFVFAFSGFLISGVCLADDEGPGVEEVAQEQAIKLGFIVHDETFDAWLFTQDGKIDKGGEKTRSKLHSIAESYLEEIGKSCHLTDEQKKKLRLAATGDIVGLFDRVEELRTRSQKTFSDPHQLKQIRQEIQPLQIALNSGPFGAGSIFQKIAARTLTPEQNRQFLQFEKERIRFQYQSAIRICLTELETFFPLTHQQRNDLINLVLDETSPPKQFGRFNHQVVLIQMASLPREKLRKILDPVQMRLLEEQLGQAPGIQGWLKETGVLEEAVPVPQKETPLK